MRGTIIYKMTGSGNDFVVLDGRFTSPEQWPATRVAAMCDRRSGVGADGLVILTPDVPGRVRMTYWNSDGSRAAMCGNAALCSTRLAVYLELAEPGELCLLTDAGVVPGRSNGAGDSAEIGLPDAEVPTEVSGLEPSAGERWLVLGMVGVPHLIVRVDDIERIDVSGRGRALRFDERLGEAGANVNFVAPGIAAGEAWTIRTYERGIEAETLACGTGAVAAAIALAAREEASLPVRFRSRGGPELLVRAELLSGRAHDIWLGGQGRLLFRGVWEGV
ncbi:MAG: diaminopimelate epimerase [Gemmatimonadales bacterium]|nr:diaminopimelate epimerase [Gemmatimonadales bacterium]